MAKSWHNYLKRFCEGLGTTEPAQVSNASFIGKKLFRLWMPSDYEREGKAGVFSATVIRELYLLDLRGWKPNGGPGRNKKAKELKVGKMLSRRDRDHLKLASVYLGLNGTPASALFSPEEEQVARTVVEKLKEETPAPA